MLSIRSRVPVYCALLALVVGLSSHVNAAEPDATVPDFERQIAPLLVRSCVGCHNANESSGELDLTRRDRALAGGESGAAAITPGSVEESYLVERVAAGEMPPEGKGQRLSADELGVLSAWVAAGAPWPEGRTLSSFEFTTASRAGLDWWSLQPPVEPGTPPVSNQQWVRNPIDAFVLEKLERHGLSPAPQADRATYIRRLKLDLLGLPPAPEEIRQFVEDASPNAYETLVDRFLASPHYGERWGRHWLDVVRFAESNGYETNTARPNAWPYRDYVIQALNEDRPYPQFILEQLAGDQVGVDAGTGFLVGGAHDIVSSPDIELTLQQRMNDLDDIISTTSTAFLGLTAGCAKCHDHKFDPITQHDYYALQAVFAGVQHGEREIRPADSDQRRQQADTLRRELADVEGQIQDLLARFEPVTRPADLVWLDDLARQDMSSQVRGVMVLQPPVETTRHAAGTGRGQLSDRGDIGRPANVGQGYTYWRNVAGSDVFSWNPALAGDFRIWLSWGCGWDTHAADAQYLLDSDGDLTTRDDQQVIATIDQRRHADGSGDLPGEALWSGFFNAGTHRLAQTSRLVLRGGATEAYVTADVVLFERVDGAVPDANSNESHIASFIRPGVHPLGNVERFEPFPARFVRFTVQSTNGLEPCLDELEIFTAGPEPRNVALASAGAKATASSIYENGNSPIHRLEHVNDGRYGNSRSWISAEIGSGWVQIELPEVTSIERISWARDREGVYRDRLAVQYRIEAGLSPDSLQVIATSDDRAPYDPQIQQTLASGNHLPPTEAAQLKQLQSVADALNRELGALEPQRAYVGTFAEPEPTYRLHRGEPLQKREEVLPGVIASLGNAFTLPGNAPEAQRRLMLARWIGSEQNPLTARVMVNRLWHYHFGQGLIKTPGDFGFHGGRPSHPELLDWLAVQFMKQEWRLKPLHRLIVLSNTYRQSSRYHARAAEIDAGGQWLWRFNPRRLEAEPIRDSMLWVSGVLDRRMSGPGYDVFEPNDNYVKVYNPKQTFGPAEWRRMVYQNKPRMRQDATFGEFDCPDSSQPSSKRNVSTTALQALNLLNSPFVVQQAELFAKRLTQELPDDSEGQVRRAFELAFGRGPDQAELTAAVALIRQQGLPVFCRTLLNANEFIYLN